MFRLGGSDGVDLRGEEGEATERAGEPRRAASSDLPEGVVRSSSQLQDTLHAQRVTARQHAPLRTKGGKEVKPMFRFQEHNLYRGFKKSHLGLQSTSIGGFRFRVA